MKLLAIFGEGELRGNILGEGVCKIRERDWGYWERG